MASIILQLLLFILLVFTFLLASFSLYILYLRRVKFGHLPGPPVSSFFKGRLKIFIGLDCIVLGSCNPACLLRHSFWVANSRV
jgi:hypothetical protein